MEIFFILVLQGAVYDVRGYIRKSLCLEGTVFFQPLVLFELPIATIIRDSLFARPSALGAANSQIGRCSFVSQLDVVFFVANIRQTSFRLPGTECSSFGEVKATLVLCEKNNKIALFLLID